MAQTKEQYRLEKLQHQQNQTRILTQIKDYLKFLIEDLVPQLTNDGERVQKSNELMRNTYEKVNVQNIAEGRKSNQLKDDA